MPKALLRPNKALGPSHLRVFTVLFASFLPLLLVKPQAITAANSQNNRCEYVSDLAEGYPYPYKQAEWFSFVEKETPRHSPAWLLQAFDGEESQKQREVLEQIYSRSFLLDESLLLRSRSHEGDLTRLHLALHKLVTGEPITVLALGGEALGGDGVYGPRREVDGAFGQITRWISTTFPNKNHRFHNGCVPSATSPFISMCLNKRLKFNDADIVILEFDTSDYSVPFEERYMENPWRRGMEVLLRRLLTQASHPALVYVHAWIPGLFNHTFLDVTVEEETGLLVKYYALPSISMRNALYAMYDRSVSGFREQDFTCSAILPNYLGHRYMADAVIAWLQDQLALVLLSPPGPQERAAAAKEIPFPLLERNSEKIVDCLEDTSLQKSSLKNMGWSWQNEEYANGEVLPGFVSLKPHSTLTLKMDTRNWGDALARHSRRGLTLAFGYLKSNAGMGMARVECTLGCRCLSPAESRKFDAHWDRPEAMLKWLYVGVSESRACILQVTNLKNTTSGGHKIAISALGILPFDWRHGDFFAGWIVDGILGPEGKTSIDALQYPA